MIPHRLLFHLIAPVYRLFFKRQFKGYREILEKHISELNLPADAKMLEVGCGTGAFGKALSEFYTDVSGLDFARGMVDQAQKSGVSCFEADFFSFEKPKEWDVIWMAFVAHGWSPEKRMLLYHKALETARGKVIFFDYNRKRNFWISLIECLEGGTYFSFIKDPVAEMKTVFRNVKVIEVYDYVNLYVCEV